MSKRLLYARLHSAGLLGNTFKQIFLSLKGIRGNHFPNGQAFVVYGGEIPVEIQEQKEKIISLVNELIKKGLPIEAGYDNQVRNIKIGDFLPQPCGGTHVWNTFEIGEIIIRKIKKNKGNLRIGYDINYN